MSRTVLALPPVRKSSHVLLDGSAGCFVSAPDSAATSLTNVDLDVRVRVALDDWTPAANQILIAKGAPTGSQLSWHFAVLTSGVLRVQYSTDGVLGTNRDSTVAAGIADGAVKWVRFTFDRDVGATNHEVKFFTSDDGVTWAQLGATVSNLTTVTFHDSTAGMQVGAQDGNSRAAGRVFEAEVRSGIAGTVVAGPRFGARGRVLRSFTDAEGNAWSLGGSAVLA